MAKIDDRVKSHQDGWQSMGSMTVPLHQMHGLQSRLGRV
jgi:hypothetical protein